MKIEDLISVCRFYKGESNPPEMMTGRAAGSLWYTERAWTFDTLRAIREGEEGPTTKFLDELLSDYIRAGLADFQNMDGIPVGLKAYIFHWYMAGSMSSMRDTAPRFKKFYLKHYKQ